MGKLRALETEATFTDGWDDLLVDIFRWETMARGGLVECAEVPRMAAAFALLGVA